MVFFVVAGAQVGGASGVHSIVKGKKVVWEIRQTWTLILALSLPGCVTWGKLLNISDPQFHL